MHTDAEDVKLKIINYILEFYLIFTTLMPLSK